MADANDKDRQRALTIKVLDGIAAAAESSEPKQITLPTTVNSQALFSEGGTAGGGLNQRSGVPERDHHIHRVYRTSQTPDTSDCCFEVQAAFPGVPLNDWDVAPTLEGLSDPCWYVVVPEGWLEAFSKMWRTAAPLRWRVAPRHDRWAGWIRADIVQRSGLTHAIVDGHVVRAACGRTFIPGQDPNGKEMCIRCAAHHQEIEAVVSTR